AKLRSFWRALLVRPDEGVRAYVVSGDTDPTDTTPTTACWSNANHKQMCPFAFRVRIPVSIQQMGEDLCLDFRILCPVNSPAVAPRFFSLSPRALRIHLGLEQNVLPVRGPQFAIGL